MRYATTIDGIVRSTLMTLGLPIHYYVQFMHYALKCLNQELNMDTLPLVKTIEVSLDSNNELSLPNDFIDIVKLGRRVHNDHRIKVFGVNDNFARLAVDRDNLSPATDEVLASLNYGGYFFTNFYNDKGEHKGRMYGYGNDTQGSEYKLIRERGVIKVSPSVPATAKIYLEYVGFHSATSASGVNPYAAECIEAYIIYKFKEHNRGITKNEAAESKQEYYNQLRKLRSRVMGLTKTDVLRLVRGEFRQSVKI
jgi:hypothetical protein